MAEEPEPGEYGSPEIRREFSEQLSNRIEEMRGNKMLQAMLQPAPMHSSLAQPQSAKQGGSVPDKPPPGAPPSMAADKFHSRRPLKRPAKEEGQGAAAAAPVRAANGPTPPPAATGLPRQGSGSLKIKLKIKPPTRPPPAEPKSAAPAGLPDVSGLITPPPPEEDMTVDDIVARIMCLGGPMLSPWNDQPSPESPVAVAMVRPSPEAADGGSGSPRQEAPQGKPSRLAQPKGKEQGRMVAKEEAAEEAQAPAVGADADADANGGAVAVRGRKERAEKASPEEPAALEAEALARGYKQADLKVSLGSKAAILKSIKEEKAASGGKPEKEAAAGAPAEQPDVRKQERAAVSRDGNRGDPKQPRDAEAAKGAGRRAGQADDSEGAAPALKPTSAGEKERRPSGDGGETPGGQHPRGRAELEPERRREPEDGAGRASAAAAPAKAREEESERRQEREPSKEVAGARGAEDRRGGRLARSDSVRLRDTSRPREERTEERREERYASRDADGLPRQSSAGREERRGGRELEEDREQRAGRDDSRHGGRVDSSRYSREERRDGEKPKSAVPPDKYAREEAPRGRSERYARGPDGQDGQDRADRRAEASRREEGPRRSNSQTRDVPDRRELRDGHRRDEGAARPGRDERAPRDDYYDSRDHESRKERRAIVDVYEAERRPREERVGSKGERERARSREGSARADDTERRDTAMLGIAKRKLDTRKPTADLGTAAEGSPSLPRSSLPPTAPKGRKREADKVESPVEPAEPLDGPTRARHMGGRDSVEPAKAAAGKPSVAELDRRKQDLHQQARALKHEADKIMREDGPTFSYFRAHVRSLTKFFTWAMASLESGVAGGLALCTQVTTLAQQSGIAQLVRWKVKVQEAAPDDSMKAMVTTAIEALLYRMIATMKTRALKAQKGRLQKAANFKVSTPPGAGDSGSPAEQSHSQAGTPDGKRQRGLPQRAVRTPEPGGSSAAELNKFVAEAKEPMKACLECIEAWEQVASRTHKLTQRAEDVSQDRNLVQGVVDCVARVGQDAWTDGKAFTAATDAAVEAIEALYQRSLEITAAADAAAAAKRRRVQ